MSERQAGDGRGFNLKGLLQKKLPFRRSAFEQSPELAGNISQMQQVPPEVVYLSDRINHPADSLTVTPEMQLRLEQNDIHRLRGVKDAIVGDGNHNKGINRNTILLMDDTTIIDYEPESDTEHGKNPVGIRIQVIEQGENNLAHNRTKFAIKDALENRFGNEQRRQPGTNNVPKELTEIKNLDNLHSIVTLPPAEGNLPIHIDVRTVPGLHLSDYIKQLQDEGREFSAYRTRKEDTTEFTKEDYYELLTETELRAVRKTALVIHHGLSDAIGTRVAMIADGSLTEKIPTEGKCNDIDLRVVYVHDPYRRNNSDLAPENIARILSQSMRDFMLGAKYTPSLHEEDIDDTNPELQTQTTERIFFYDEVTGHPRKEDRTINEPSYSINVKGSERKIHLTISGNPVTSIEDALIRNRRIDRPVILEDSMPMR